MLTQHSGVNGAGCAVATKKPAAGAAGSLPEG